MDKKIELDSLCVVDSICIMDALKKINSNAEQMIIVTDFKRSLRGIVTDGDIRRGIIKGLSLDAPVSLVMNDSPKFASQSEDKSLLLKKMTNFKIKFLPLVNDDHIVVDVIRLSDLYLSPKFDNTVVIMAGGKGTRLGTLTKDCPKPMLKIGNKPILETIISNFAKQGFYNFVISVNYLKEKIVNYFDDGNKLGVNISYVYEDFPLGTAGGLSKLQINNELPFIVTNGDIYTDLDFSNLLNTHVSSGAVATMCLRKYDVQVPYGVVKIENGRILSLKEKPVISNYVNAGIYVLDKKVINKIPKDTFYPMTFLFEKLISESEDVRSYEIDGIWIDIGHQADFEMAKSICQNE